jgi:hypothetical protein
MFRRTRVYKYMLDEEGSAVLLFSYFALVIPPRNAPLAAELGFVRARL